MYQVPLQWMRQWSFDPKVSIVVFSNCTCHKATNWDGTVNRSCFYRANSSLFVEVHDSQSLMLYILSMACGRHFALHSSIVHEAFLDHNCQKRDNTPVELKFLTFEGGVAQSRSTNYWRKMPAALSAQAHKTRLSSWNEDLCTYIAID